MEPDVDGYLVRVDDLPLDEILGSQDTALTEALRRLLAANAAGHETAISAFNNFI
jgi:FXSXX-COOH protein